MTGDVATVQTGRAWKMRARMKKSGSDGGLAEETTSMKDQKHLPLSCNSSMSSMSDDNDKGDEILRNSARQLPTGRSSSSRKLNYQRYDGKTLRPSLARRQKLEKQESASRRTSILGSLDKFSLDSQVSEKDLLKPQVAGGAEKDLLEPKVAAKVKEKIPTLKLPPLAHGKQRRRSSIATDRVIEPKESIHRMMGTWSPDNSISNLTFDPLTRDKAAKTQRISTSASNEQWSRFKLLGRAGLGDLKLSEEANVLVDRVYVYLSRAIDHIVALQDDDDDSLESLDETTILDIQTGNLLEEVRHTIQVTTKFPKYKRDPERVQISEEAQDQLRDFVSVIAVMYRDNSFHNFEHASNVLRAVDSLVATVAEANHAADPYGRAAVTHPWNHFALLFSALIHDVDHQGVSNAQLISEGSHIAEVYKQRSIAEQNSIELAWNVFMEPCYRTLRDTLFLYRSELVNFRNLVVKAVMATDVADKEMAEIRKGIMEQVRRTESGVSTSSDESDTEYPLRKATFLFETCMQAADVSHAMSPFDEFVMWNKRLYKEVYKAYLDGRADKDPTESWFADEFKFFDYYLIPLAKKLGICAIYGEASDNFVAQAMDNRRQWKDQGESLVAGFSSEMHREDRPIMTLKRMVKSNVSYSSLSSDDLTDDSDLEKDNPPKSSQSSLSSEESEFEDKPEPKPELEPEPEPEPEPEMKPKKKSADKKKTKKVKMKSTTNGETKEKGKKRESRTGSGKAEGGTKSSSGKKKRSSSTEKKSTGKGKEKEKKKKKTKPKTKDET